MPQHRTSWAVHQDFFSLYDRMLTGFSVPEVLDDVARVVQETMNAEGASVYLVRHDTQELEANARVGCLATTIRVPMNTSSLAGFCATRGQAFLVPDAYADLSSLHPELVFDRTWDDANAFRTRDVLCAPATFKNETVGVVQVINSLRAPFEDADLNVLLNVARLVGYALHHLRLYNDLSTQKQLQKEKAKFVRVMVHELKSPLSAAMLLAETVAMPSIADEKRLELAGRIGRRLEGMLELIKDTLDLSAVSSGEALSVVDVIDLTEAVRKATASHSERALAKGLDLRLSLPEDAVLVHFDTRGLELVISNLVSNAVKYTTQGVVEVQVAAKDNQAVLCVKDTGMGIPAGEVDKLFGEFHRASNARRAKIEGSGVGLASVKTLLERFSGSIFLETEENKGSTFRVELPLMTDAKRPSHY